jgi:imidazolonepropionase-like amidohydrolase
MNIANIKLHKRRLGKGLKSLSVACGLLAALTGTAVYAQQKVDTVVTNGKILTVDANFRVVEALAIDNGRIVASGKSAEMARYVGRDTKTIDVKGATVIPGLIDNHFHFTRAVERWHQQARFEVAARGSADSRGQGREPVRRPIRHIWSG